MQVRWGESWVRSVAPPVRLAWAVVIDEVVLTVSNLDAVSLMSAGQCDASILDGPDRFAVHLQQCSFDLMIPPADGRVTSKVVETITAGGLPSPAHWGTRPASA